MSRQQSARRMATRHPLALTGVRFDVPCAETPALHNISDGWFSSRLSIDWHAHPPGTWECYVQLDGSSTWELRPGRRRLDPAQAYLVPPGVQHRLQRVHGDRHHFRYAMLDLERIVRESLPHLAADLRRVRAAGFVTGPGGPLSEAFSVVLSAVARPGLRQADAVRAGLVSVALTLFDLALQPDQPVLRIESATVAAARRLIDAEPGWPWTLSQLAHRTGTSPKRLCTAFGQQVGQTPHQYLMGCRLRLSQQRLRDTDLSISEIASELGFSSSQHLAQVFQQRLRTTPSAYRRRYGG